MCFINQFDQLISLAKHHEAETYNRITNISSQFILHDNFKSNYLLLSQSGVSALSDAVPTKIHLTYEVCKTNPKN